MYTRPVPVTAYQAGEGFLSQKQKLVRQVVLPYQYDILNDRLPGVEKSHAIENLRQAARKMAGEQVPPESFYGMVFQDSDVAKWMEAAAYALAAGPDQELEARLEETIDLLEQGQHEDGYLNSYFTVKAPGKEWTDLQEAHELYCAGHLMEAAVAYFEATGRDRFLKIMERNADCIYRHFTEVCPRGFSGHPEVELALLKLYRATGNETYKELCAHFIDVRGQSPNYFIEERKTRGWHVWDQGDPNGIDTDYTQSTKPVREQQDAVGHAVRAVYLYTAMADLARESGDPTLKTACETLWKSITEKRMYVTGGIGSTVLGEAFTVDYDLPGDTAYAETCASIGLVFFARRMLELDPKGQYGDVMERALYNTVLAGMAQDGRRFFYVNPLEVVPGISGEAATQRHAPAPAAPVVRLRLLPAQRGQAAHLHRQLRLHRRGERPVRPPVPGGHRGQRPGLVPHLRDRLPPRGRGALHLPRPGAGDHPGPADPRVEQAHQPAGKRPGGGPFRPDERRLRLPEPRLPGGGPDHPHPGHGAPVGDRQRQGARPFQPGGGAAGAPGVLRRGRGQRRPGAGAVLRPRGRPDPRAL